MSKLIYKALEEGLEREIDRMPYGLSKRQVRRLTDKALDKVVRRVSNKFGVPNVDIKGIKDIFWEANMSFPSFDDECYIQLMRGEKGKLVRIGAFERLRETRSKGLRDFTNDILYEDEWGANYDPRTKTMLGGLSKDGVRFLPCFRITEVEEGLMPTALALCLEVSKKLDIDKLDITFGELLECYSESYSEEGHEVVI